MEKDQPPGSHEVEVTKDLFFEQPHGGRDSVMVDGLPYGHPNSPC